MSGPPGRQIAKASGFTLLELLVVMSLLSIVMLALGSALTTVAQAAERIDLRLASAEEMRVSVGFLRSTFGRVSARKVASTNLGVPQVFFVGQPQAVEWVGIMPARYGAGGRHFFRVSQEQVDGDQALVLRFLPWQERVDRPEWAAAQMRVLVGKVVRVGFRYLDAQGATPSWNSDGASPERLPDQVQLRLETPNGDWPVLIFPMRVLPASDPNLGVAVFGGD